MKEITNYDYKFWADATDNLIKGLPKLLSAIKTLESKGYTYQGGELWKPPVGKKPDFSLIDSLNEKIKEFESEKYINEIKAQGIDEAIKKADNETYIGIVGQEFPPQSQYKAELLCYAEQLKAKHE